MIGSKAEEAKAYGFLNELGIRISIPAGVDPQTHSFAIEKGRKEIRKMSLVGTPPEEFERKKLEYLELIGIPVRGCTGKDVIR